jgi:ATP-dependent protease ClpP protease subunit
MRVSLNGIVSSDDDLDIYQWFGCSAFSPKSVRQALADNPAGEELVVEINSGGGSVFAGNEIYSLLRSAAVPTRAEIQSLAASAASYLALGCDQVWISPCAQMMIHLPSTTTYGNRVDHLNSVQELDTIRDSILAVYELKARGKTDRAELKRMMNASTWFTAQEAVDRGLADGILYQDAAVTDVMNAVGCGIRALGASSGMPDLDQMRAEYRRQKGLETGNPPAEDSQKWRQKARIELEKIRYGG